MTVDPRLHVNLADALQNPDEEGVDGNQRAGMRGFDMVLAKLRREAFEQAGLLLGQFEWSLGGSLLQRNSRSCLVSRL